MTRHARSLILALAALGLFASVASLYVHYHVIKDPTYTSFCDISETVSCEALYQSAYGTVYGIPVAAGGAIWSALVLLLAWLGMRGPKAEQVSGVAGYIFVLSTVGLAVVLYLGYASFFVIGKYCPLCITMYVSVIGTFIVAGAAASESLAALPSRALSDVRGLLASPVAATLAVLWLVGSVSLVAFFPREEAAAAADASTAAAVDIPTETMTPEQRTEFDRWIQAQPRVTLPVSADGAQVLVVKFNDYQCPACRQTYMEYKGIVARFQKEYGSRIKFVTMDFPLEAECGNGSVHPSACEAAAAVRMAKAKGRGEAMEEWLFTHQDTMTPDTVKEGLREIAQVTDFDTQYPKTLDLVRADAKLGRELGVTGTPAFFINGIKVAGGLRPIYFDALLMHELMSPPPAKPN